MEELAPISIVGTGYVGLTTAAVLANAGFKVFTIDIVPEKIETIKKGRAYFYEEALDELISKAIDTGNLVPTLSYEESIPESDIVFSCVGTPDRPDGSHNLDYIYGAAESVARVAKDGLIMVQKSTVPVGTGREVISKMKKANPELQFEYVSNPEFLREGSAVYNTLNMQRVILGSDSTEAMDRIEAVYKKVDELCKKLEGVNFGEYTNLAIGRELKAQTKSFEDRVFKMRLESAELVKVSANAFLALKISFANSIAKLADKTEADINEVMDGVGSDTRIGRAFLYAGLGWGGGCFPKDVSGLIAVADDRGVGMSIMNSAVNVNDSMIDYGVEKLQRHLSDLKDKKIAVLGLAFKPGTSDVRKSQAIKLANKLTELGASVAAYDPKAMEEAKETLASSVVLKESIMDTVSDADAVVLAVDWKDFVIADWEAIKDAMSGDVLFDGRNKLDIHEMSALGFRYEGVGRR
ncbi:nucleotide sugar dehydrogenase [Candidatus Dojkabacteria bacterium]|nr:nucleotide sugar dehydrogenase [Candidatus Dojkabacteria bacterium]